MALSRDDLTYDKGNIGYGTMASLPEPGSAGDLAAEAASAGIVNTDASAELAQQVPDIVVPVNQSSDSDSNSDIDINTNTGIKTLNTGNLGKYITKDRAISYGLSQVHPLLGLAYTTYKYFNPGMDQAIVDAAETARLDDTPENAGYATESDKIMAEGDIAFAETGDYDVYSDTPTGTNTYTGAPTTYSYEIAFEPEPTYTTAVDSEENQPTYTAPAPAPTYTYYDGGSDSDNDSGGSFGGSGQETQDNMYASGGIVARLRKNKQNTRIHDRRKRLAMGGITSLHG